MNLPTIHTPLGDRLVLIPENDGQYNAQEWRDTITSLIAEYAKTPLPKCLHKRVRQEFFSNWICKIIQSLGDDNRLRFTSMLPNSRRLSENDWDIFKSEKMLEEAAKQLNCTTLTLARALAQLLGIKPEYCFDHFPANWEAFGTFRPWQNGDIFPPFSTFRVGNKIYQHTATDYLCGLNGEWQGAVFQYSGEDGNEYVFAVRFQGQYSDKITIGENAPPAFLFGRDKAINNPSLPCIVCLNPDVSMELRRVTQDAPLGKRHDFTILANYGSIEALILDDINGLDVIIACSPDREEWDMLPGFLKRCEAAAANSIRVCAIPIVGEYCRFGKRQLTDKAKDMLDAMTINLADCDRISKMYEQLSNSSFATTDLQKFIKEYHLDDSPDENVDVSSEQCFQPWDFCNDDEDRNKPLTLRRFFNERYTTLVYAGSNIGKSYFVMMLSIALATGRPVFGFRPSDPAKVFYLDGEIGPEFSGRVRQLSQGLLSEAEYKLLDKNLQVKSLGNSRLLSDEVDVILEVLKNEKPDVLVIDNILSLAPHAWRSKSETLHDFLTNIKSIGIAPIVVHHTGKDGHSYLGTVSLEALSQNIIRLDNVRLQDI